MASYRGGIQRGCSGITRHQFLTDTGMGFTGVALAAMLQREGIGGESAASGEHLPSGLPHLVPRARRVIWLMMRGGVSHVEGFDPKPALTKYGGKTLSETPWHDAVVNSPYAKNVREQVANNVIMTNKARIYPLQVGFRKCGQSGVEVSDWWPHVRQHVDEMAIIRSMWTTDNNHGAQLEFLTGRHLLDGCYPTLGAWIHYGLGTLNENLPQFISIGPLLETQCFEGLDATYLGPEHAGVVIKVDPADPLPYARPELQVSAREQLVKANLVNQLNRLTAIEYPGDTSLQARIKSYELAFRMQSAVPAAMRFEEETEATQQLYGLDQDVTRPFGQQCLAVRRFAERGVRFIQLFHGGGAAGEWDAHSGLVKNHTHLTAQVDRPIAGLLTDLRQRGLLDDTILVWTSEFGRTPGGQGSDGRDHHNYGFTVWIAGGGIRPGIVHGATDELGYHAVEDRHYVTDIHATIMQLLGLDARRLEVPGRKRLEREYGSPIPEIIA